ncbi:MAG: hypothetical protein MJY82_09375 [Fibrobacter sp.]|nr:hypothetical protein [Fibrobacter sp.]
MNSNTTDKGLPVIEVPPELRGPSDEEILARGEREDTPKRRCAAQRLSKRKRDALKKERELSKMQNIAKIVEQKEQIKSTKTVSISAESLASLTNLEKPVTVSEARKKLDALFTKVAQVVRTEGSPSNESVAQTAQRVLKTVIADTLKPSSGRVLKGAFSANRTEQPKAVVMSAAELQRQRMEERAKKVREALMAKNGVAPTSTAGAVNPDGTPVKRPRGRPRKNPIV